MVWIFIKNYKIFQLVYKLHRVKKYLNDNEYIFKIVNIYNFLHDTAYLFSIQYFYNYSK